MWWNTFRCDEQSLGNHLKRRLVEDIIPCFPKHDCYVEVFAGGAALYFMRASAKVEVINDINGELVNLYRVVQHHLEEIVRQFKWALTSRQVFEWLKHTVPFNGRAIVSLNDRREIRRVFAGFHIESVPIQYTIGGGKGVERRELIIFSWDDSTEPAGLF
ncbi:DNA adenine methylase [Burkholderia pseudomallei]